MCFINIEGEVHCVGLGLVPARAGADRGPLGGHKGRPYKANVLQTLQFS
jgi:hypothetical protein